VLKASKDIAGVMKDRIDSFAFEIVNTRCKLHGRMDLVEEGMLEGEVAYWIWEASCPWNQRVIS